MCDVQHGTTLPCKGSGIHQSRLGSLREVCGQEYVADVNAGASFGNCHLNLSFLVSEIGERRPNRASISNPRLPQAWPKLHNCLATLKIFLSGAMRSSRGSPFASLSAHLIVQSDGDARRTSAEALRMFKRHSENEKSAGSPWKGSVDFCVSAERSLPNKENEETSEHEREANCAQSAN